MTSPVGTKKSPKRHRRQRSALLSTILGPAIMAAAAAAILSLSTRPSGHYFEAEAFTVLNHRPPLPFSPPSSPRRPPMILRRCPQRGAGKVPLLFSSNDEATTRREEGTNHDEIATAAVGHFANSEVSSSPPPSPSAETAAVVVRSPLKFVGPYPCLALKFPNLSTESQRSKNLTGIGLDFVLDTAANVNTIQGQVAKELRLDALEDSPAPPGVSSSGPMGGGETYVLGDSELERAEIVAAAGAACDSNSNGETASSTVSGSDDEPFEFMQNLTAAALPVVNPGTAGLLGLAFFYCFEGGVEFRWGDTAAVPGTEQRRLVDGMVSAEPTVASLSDAPSSSSSSPSITFYGADDTTTTVADPDDEHSPSSSELKEALSGLDRVPIRPIPLTQLPSVQLKINGVEMTALLDTGSPVTVLNERAAEEAGIKTTKESLLRPSSSSSSSGNKNNNSGGGWKNPFASAMDKFKEAQATAEAASKGDVLMIGGIDGKPANLYRSTGDSANPTISLVGSSGEDVPLVVGNDDGGIGGKVYVGDIPGLAALNGIGVDSPPAVVLGLDVLRRRPRMVFRPRQNELYL